MASFLYDSLQPSSQYYDRRSDLTEVEYKKTLEITTTVYVGNLHCSTSEGAMYELFARAGQILDIIMGVTKEGIFAGFCFVVYQTHEEARIAVDYLSSTKLYDRVIRVDWDYGFKEGRQYGRGIDGYQKRDQYRQANDAGRHNVHGQWKEHQQRQQQQHQHHHNHHHRQQHNQAHSQDKSAGFYGGRGNRRYDGEGGYRRGQHGPGHHSHDRNGTHFGNNENKYKKNYNQFKSEYQKREKSSQSPTEKTNKRFHKNDETEE